jgi:hypothetical protein
MEVRLHPRLLQALSQEKKQLPLLITEALLFSIAKWKVRCWQLVLVPKKSDHISRVGLM